MNPFLPPESQASAQAPEEAAAVPQAAAPNPFLPQTETDSQAYQAAAGAAEAAGPPHPQEPGSFSDKLDIFNRGFERYALGGLQLMNGMVRNTLGKIPGIGEDISKGADVIDQKLTQTNQDSEKNYQEAYKRTPSPYVDALGKLGGAVISGTPAVMATTSAGPLSIGRAMLQGGASGFETGVTEYADSNSERLIRGAVGGIAGATLPGAVLAGSAASKVATSGLGEMLMPPVVTNVLRWTSDKISTSSASGFVKNLFDKASLPVDTAVVATAINATRSTKQKDTKE